MLVSDRSYIIEIHQTRYNYAFFGFNIYNGHEDRELKKNEMNRIVKSVNTIENL